MYRIFLLPIFFVIKHIRVQAEVGQCLLSGKGSFV
jgi:hypothetical protein